MKKKIEFFDAEAEKRVLSFIMNTPSRLYECQEILSDETTFYNHDHALFYEVITELDRDGLAITFAKMCIMVRSKSLSNEKQVLQILAEIKNITTSILDFENDCKYIEELYRKRATLQNLQNAINEIEKNATIKDVGELVADAQKMLEIGSRNNIVTIKKATDYVMESLDKKVAVKTVPTGISVLNKLTGGWQPSEMIVIAGRPGMGKTIVGVNHAIYAAKAGIPVAYITFEVPSEKLIERALSMQSSIPAANIKFRDLSMNQKETLFEAAKVLQNLPIYFYDYGQSDDIADITATMKHWKNKYGIGLVIIDYQQLIRDSSLKNADEYGVVTSVSRKIKRLQSYMNVPFICLAQLSRATETRAEKRPMLSDLRSSGQIEQDASIVIGLYNDDYYAKIKAQNEGNMSSFIPTNILEYHVLKNRDGELATIAMRFEPKIQRISDLEPNYLSAPF